MNLSRAWLNDYVDTTTSAADLGERFMMTSSEMEGRKDWAKCAEGLIIGHVDSLTPHPNADRLRVAKVNCGSMVRTIVCGGVNLAEGQTVLVAEPGTTLHPVSGEPFTIQEAEIRGVTSSGMLCALEEIGIPFGEPKHIFVFDTAHKPGTRAAQALLEDDTVLDLEITPNRPDLLSHIGLAREVATFERRRLVEPAIATLPTRQQYPYTVEVTVANHKDCPRYSGIVLEDIKPGASPWWMQSRLLRCGIRPITAVVDIANYVMLEFGQPLHAFSLESMAKNTTVQIQVRRARSGEMVKLLDGSERQLHPDDLVVTDHADTVTDLAGIMGGADSMIADTTTAIFLESATFSGGMIRATSRRLGLRTEASLRFEKGLDSELPVKALKRAVYLLQEICGAKVASRLTENSSSHPYVSPKIHVSFDQIHKVLGVRVSAADCKSILIGLGFHLLSFTKSGFDAVPPSWRRDVVLAEDVIEEIVRIWGYDRLPYTLPTGAVKAPFPDQVIACTRTLRRTAAALGYQETLHQVFSSEAALNACNLTSQQAIKLPNPLSAESAYLNPTHLLGMLAGLGSANAEHTELQFFEIGKTFTVPHTESQTLTLLVRTSKSAEDAVRTLKGSLEALLKAVELPSVTLHQAEVGLPYAASGTTAAIHVADTFCGNLGVVDPSVLQQNKIKRGKHIAFAELKLDALLKLESISKHYAPVPQFPVSTRAFTVQIAEHVPVSALQDALADILSRELVLSSKVTDIFRGSTIEKGKKAVTLEVRYTAPDRTLTDEEITAEMNILEKALENFAKHAH